jgi:hypothetical protein
MALGVNIYLGVPHLDGKSIGTARTPFFFVIDEEPQGLVKSNQPLGISGGYSYVVNTANGHSTLLLFTPEMARARPA